MIKKNYLNEEILKFNSFLNKTIILSAKEYFRKELKKKDREIQIIDDENFSEYINQINKYEEKFFDNQSSKNSIDFINYCENLRLHTALKSLTAIEQSVIFLLYSEELSQEEAAKILKICTKSVSRIKLRAFDKLKKYFEEGDLYE